MYVNFIKYGVQVCNKKCMQCKKLFLIFCETRQNQVWYLNLLFFCLSKIAVFYDIHGINCKMLFLPHFKQIMS